MKPHPHHYVFPPPNGPTSVGVCKHCGATVEQPNSQVDKTWNRWQGKGQKRVRLKTNGLRLRKTNPRIYPREGTV